MTDLRIHLLLVRLVIGKSILKSEFILKSTILKSVVDCTVEDQISQALQDQHFQKLLFLLHFTSSF